MLLLTTFVFAQRIIKGKVTENGEAVIGANVIAKGTKATTTTDIDGNYKLNVPKEATQIEFTYVGMASQLITFGASDVLDVILRPDKALEEVVVIGYGTQKRKDLTGSITSITSENFVKGPIQTPEQLVAGKVAGVQITSNGGRPGGGSTIRIRGGSSLNASNDPLIVIDGVPVDNGTINGAPSPLSLINPSDIESITVLRDASATAIYGARAANGVILVVTKKGTTGKPKVNFSTVASVGQVFKTVDVFSADEYKVFLKENSPVLGVDTLLGKTSTNWQDEIYQNALSLDNNISITGSVGKNFPYRVSGNFLNQNGILLNSNMKRTGASVGLSPKFFNEALKVDVNYRVARITNRFADQGAIGSAIVFDPTQPVKSSDTIFNQFGGYFEWTDGGVLSTNSSRNPVGLLKQKQDESTVTRQIGNIQLNYAIPFVEGLKANMNVGFDASSSNGEKRTPARSGAGNINRGYYGEYYQNKTNKLFEVFLNYNKKIGKNNIDVIAGHSYQNFYNETRGFDVDSLPKGNSPVTLLQQRPDTSRNVIASFFGRLNYNYKEKYYLTSTLRSDGSSRFASENRWGYFPSLALAWKISEEGFLKGNRFLSDLKLRLGYGVTGQQDINANYGYQPNYILGDITTSYIFGKDTIRTFRPNAYDRNLQWEQTTTYNAAIDFGFFGGKVFGSIDFYNRETERLISEIDVPAGSNLKNTILTNIGSLTNKGFELILNYQAINTKDMNLTIGTNLTRNKNEITFLPVLKDEANQVGIPAGDNVSIGQKVQIHSINSPRNSFFVYKQKYDDNGKPLEGQFEDLDKNGTVDQKDQYIYKSPDPKILLGFNSQFSYKNFNCGFVMRGSFGNYIYNGVAADNSTLVSLVTADNRPRNVAKSITNTKFIEKNEKQSLSDYFVEDGSFVRMDNAYIGYNFQIKKTTLGVNFNVTNVFLLTKYTGIDPEIFNGLDQNFYPRPRTYALALNFNF